MCVYIGSNLPVLKVLNPHQYVLSKRVKTVLKLNWIIDVMIRTCTKFWAQFSDVKCRNGQEKCDDFGKQVPLPLLISYRGFYVAHHVCI